MRHVEDVLTDITDIWRKNKLLNACIAEFVGTFLLVIFGLGVTSNAIINGASVSLPEAAFVWGTALAVAIYTTASISTGHVNPAVSIAMAVVRSKEFGPFKCLCYVIAQLFGAFIAGLINFGIFNDALKAYEEANNIVRGEQSSVITEKIYGEFYGNSSWGHGFALEAFATGLFVFLILAMTDKNQNTLKNKELVPITIGLSLACIICIVGPATEACLNPARDLGPRIVAAIYGYGKLALPGPNQEMWAYIFGPIFGGILGGIAHDLLIAPGLRRSAQPYDIYQAPGHLATQRSARDLGSQRSSLESFNDEEAAVMPKSAVKSTPTVALA